MGRRLRLTCPAPLLIALLASGASVPAETRVNRCVGPDGAVEFRQQACPGVGEEVVIEDRHTGWVPSGGEGVDDDRARPPPGRDEAARKAAGAVTEAAERRQREQCWNKQRQLDSVSAKLRRGYAPAQGDDLRRKRRSLEDYVRQFCR